MTVRTRRTKNFWEPFYDPATPNLFVKSDWDFNNTSGPRFCTFDASNLPSTPTVKISNIYFDQCDFSGEFNKPIIFVECTFSRCDFGLSTFHKAKFKDCKFSLTSFTQSTIKNSEFRDCKFTQLGLSGNETNLEGTLITNPGSFIKSAHTNTKSLPKNSSKFVQLLRLEETKSTLSRSILSTLVKEGSEHSFYEASKASAVQECRAKFASNLLKAREGLRSKDFTGIIKVLSGGILSFGAIFDLLLLHFFGIINAWGASLFRPLLLGCVIASFFAVKYQEIFGINFKEGLKSSLEIMFLFGYGNYSKSSFTDAGKILDYPNGLIFLNALAGVLWYAVTIPTLVNRLTKVRS